MVSFRISVLLFLLAVQWPSSLHVVVLAFSSQSPKNNNNNQFNLPVEYSKCLASPREQIRREYVALYDEGPQWRRRLLKPLQYLRKRLFLSRQQQSTAGTLILVKSGTSEYKEQGIFCGWEDPKLTPRGIQECQHAARLLLEAGYNEPDLVYTSMLNRAIQSVWIINQELNSIFLPCYKSWRLNERHYGSIQGLRKRDAALEFGKTVVQAWRRSFKARPPPVVDSSDPAYPGNDRRYKGIVDPELLPTGESLEDCMQRQIPLWEYKISQELQNGNNVMVVGHSNSLRGLAKIIDHIADDDIEDIAFPPGIPIVYKFDKYLNPLPPQDGSLVQKHTSGVFLEKPGLLKEALKRQEEWQQTVPGANGVALEPAVQRMTTMEESLLLLKQERELEKWAEAQARQQQHSTEKPKAKQSILQRNSYNNNNFTEEIPIHLVEDVLDGDDALEEDDDDGEFEESSSTSTTTTTPRLRNYNTQASTADNKVVPNVGQVNVDRDPVVVFVRHGTTPHNELALFTGWEDPPLTEKGVEDAKWAGRLLKQHGFEFDVVYTSWLGRAIETAWYILDELDMQWLPLVKSWRLNERHYGKLTGRSKKMIGNIYGQDQLKKWRRGFDVPPPKTSSYSFSYPGNDYRRVKYVRDLRISFTESLCRSIEARELQIHRKFPKSESLMQCMARTIPFYTQKIVPEAVAKGKRVLITSHENAIRGILMHLCEIPEEHMTDLHLPNGLPLIYNVRRKCISLLDDGTGRDPMEVHDFGSAAQYLFRPCELTDEDFALMEEQASQMVALSSASTTEPTATAAPTVVADGKILTKPAAASSSQYGRYIVHIEDSSSETTTSPTIKINT